MSAALSAMTATSLRLHPWRVRRGFGTAPPVGCRTSPHVLPEPVSRAVTGLGHLGLTVATTSELDLPSTRPRGTTLMSQSFDASTGKMSGEPTPVADQVLSDVGIWRGVFDATSNGELIYEQGSAMAATRHPAKVARPAMKTGEAAQPRLPARPCAENA